MRNPGGPFDAVTFDCYGTLIDWETGILDALESLRRRSLGGAEDAWLLERYAHHEAAAERGEFVSYRTVLGRVTAAIATDLDVVLLPGEESLLADSLAAWPLFDDTVEALTALERRLPLGVLSNVDDALFAATRPALQTDFRWVVTAQQVGSYKPAEGNFRALLQTLDLPAERVMHVAQSRFHDIAPARRLGFRTVWVNRKSGRHGSGATPPSEVSPHHEVGDLHAVCDLLGVGG